MADNILNHARFFDLINMVTLFSVFHRLKSSTYNVGLLRSCFPNSFTDRPSHAIERKYRMRHANVTSSSYYITYRET